MRKKFNSQIAVLLLAMTVWGCSPFWPKSSLTWALTLQIEAPPDEQDAAIKQTVSVMERRLNFLGLSNFKVEPQGNTRVVVSLPHVPNRDRVKQFILSAGNWTQANINQYLAVVFNDEVKSIAYIKSQIFDQGEISGRFTKTSAEDLAHILNSGALPAPVRIVSETAIK